VPPPPNSPRTLPAQGTPGALVYYWASAGDSGLQELFCSGARVGVYDPKTSVYRRVNADGSLSAPVAPPWASASAPEPDGATPAQAAATPAASAAPAAGSDSSGSLPPWLPHAVGGGVVMLVLGVWLVSQRPRS
jgi:hypothetical protein